MKRGYRDFTGYPLSFRLSSDVLETTLTPISCKWNFFCTKEKK